MRGGEGREASGVILGGRFSVKTPPQPPAREKGAGRWGGGGGGAPVEALGGDGALSDGAEHAGGPRGEDSSSSLRGSRGDGGVRRRRQRPAASPGLRSTQGTAGAISSAPPKGVRWCWPSESASKVQRCHRQQRRLAEGTLGSGVSAMAPFPGWPHATDDTCPAKAHTRQGRLRHTRRWDSQRRDR